MTDVMVSVFVANPKPVDIPEPTKGYDRLRWDLAASSRLVEGRQDATVSITMTPCRMLKDGSVDEANESKRRYVHLSSIRDKDGQLTPLGKALLAVVELAAEE